MTATEELRRLIASRGQCKGIITKTENFLSACDVQDTELLQIKRERLVSAFTQYSELTVEINILDSTADKDDFDKMEEKYCTILANINNILKISSAGNGSVITSPPKHPVLVNENQFQKLPQIVIKPFNGNLSEYHHFLNLFTSVVDKNIKLSACDKLYYLNSFLEGEALDVIKHLPLDGNNYVDALNLLKQRYDNRARLVTHHINSILDIPQITRCTSASLHNLLSVVKQHLGALKNLEQPTSQWDSLLICILQKKLDLYTVRSFYLEQDSTEMPTLDSFYKFIEKKAAALETLSQASASPTQYERTRRTSLASSFAAAKDEKMKKIRCKYCSSHVHRLYACPKFKLATANERNQFINNNKSFCTICLNEHRDKCKFNFKCTVCKAPHNTLLHLNNVDESGHSEHEAHDMPSGSKVGLLCSNKKEVILPTVQVQLKAKDGTYIKTRALLDSGSQVSFVLSSLADKIECIKQNEKNTIVGICNGKSQSAEMATITIRSCIDNYNLNANCCIVNKITDDMPQFYISKNKLKIPKNISLADEKFDELAPITILLGCDIFFQALLHQVRPLNLNGPFLISTRFGHVVAGAVPTQYTSTTNKTSLFVTNKVSQTCPVYDSEPGQLEINLKQFWEAEKVPQVFTETSTEQELAEASFKESINLRNGKFQVALPLKQPMTELNLGDSFSSALQRFLNLEKRFLKDSSLYEKYRNFIKEYIELGHAEVYDISKYDLHNDAVYFLPHHPVFNEQSKTTKMRPVFDGGMLTKNKISLNDVLLNGPIVQSELFDVLVKFRFPAFTLIADIKQMFRMILIEPNNRALQNILWRDNINSAISCLQLKTVTYGLKSSSFLATRCLLELALRFKNEFPLAAEVLCQQTYIDDIHTGHDDIQVLLKIKEQLIQLLKLGGFELHKWCANDKRLISGIPHDKLSFSDDIDLNKDELCVKTLGLRYNVTSDKLFINCPETEIQDKYTRRQVLSFISKFYDPLGLVGPLFVSSKIILQKICKLHLSWDDELPTDLNEEWKAFAKNLIEMSSIEIKRHIDTRNAHKIELIGYADASNKAYGCSVYLRIVNNDGSVYVNLLCSKSRICPINKDLSTPRLELNSALLLAMLVNKMYNLLKNKYDLNVYLYLDSMIVLGWLNIEPMRLQAYVANRVIKITELTCNFHWFYVPTDQNPADCISRGVQPHLLQSHSLWWNGPVVLQNHDFIHVKTNVAAQVDLPELKCNTNKTCSAVNVINKFNFLTKYSNIDTMKRIMAYVLRFLKNCKLKPNERIYGNLSPTELEDGLNMIIKIDQHHNYGVEISSLRASRPVKGSLSSLNCYLDKNQMLRVGGRLQNSMLPYAKMHPIILVKGSNITKLLILKAHKQLMHASQKGILCFLNEKYWLVDALREIKGVIHKCITCFKLKAKNATQLMGSLPKERVCVARPFERVGIDYAGPFTLKFARVRKPVHCKGYVLLFICFVTKAVHIELASNLTTDNFLNCLKRFIARRNKPSQIFCDNASTYKCANTQLQELYKLQNSDNHRALVHNYTSDQGIEFKFVPAYSPVFAGVWEAGIKNIKYHLKRVVGNCVLTYEEFNTVLIQIEGILNSRPLTKMSSDPNDMSYLTPGHFLTGAPLTCYPEPNVTDKPVNRLSFWKQCTHMQQSFFKQWSKQYLTMLQNRPKWKSEKPNLTVGELVLLKSENISPLKWPMARIVSVYPGKDNKVRALDVKTANGHIIRTSLMKVCPLPIDD